LLPNTCAYDGEAVEALERIGSPAARLLLKRLMGGRPRGPSMKKRR